MRNPSLKNIYWGGVLFYITYLIFLTLTPFRLQLPPQRHHFPWPIGPLHFELDDFVRNIFLFLPFGFLLQGLLHKTSSHRHFQSMMISAGVSLSIETFQIIIRARYPSLTDIFSNAMGGGVGFVIGNRLEQKNLLFHLSRYRQKIALGLLLLYAALLLYLPLLAWEPFPPFSPNTKLLIGNDPGFDNPWKGSILSLAIYDQALSANQIEQYYQTGILQLSKKAIQNPQTLSRPQSAFQPLVLYSFEKQMDGFVLNRSPLKPPLDHTPIPPGQNMDEKRPGLILDGTTFLVSSEPEAKIGDRIHTTNRLTLETWIYPERQFDAGGQLVSFVKGDRGLFYFKQNIDDIVFAVHMHPLKKGRLHWEGIETAFPTIQGKPLHLVGVYDLGEMVLYVNGEKVAEEQMSDGFFALADFINMDRMAFGGRGLLGLLLFWPLGFLLSLTSQGSYSLKDRSIPKIVFSTLFGALFVGLILFVQAQHPAPFFTQRTAGAPIFALFFGIVSGEEVKRTLIILLQEQSQR